MITIDGAYGEGGGQIIRISLSLSAVTQQPVTINNIRVHRKNPGLAAQHLLAANAIATICQGKIEGAEINSQDLVFYPGCQSPP